MSLQDSIAVFLGPSLPQSRAREILEASFYPPARKGDIYRVMTSGVDTIILIDGVFHNTPAVWQRELLDAVEEGFTVFGASSMGALRAAELHTLGMKGYGVVFEWYRDALIEGDDEVALLHATEEFQYRALSVPLVNIRYTLDRAVGDHLLTSRQAASVINYLKSIPYPERSFQAVLRSPSLLKSSPEQLSQLESYLSVKALDIKMLDAAGLLRHVKATRSRDKSAPQLSAAHTTGVTKQRYQRLLMTGFHAPYGTLEGAEVLRRALADTAFTKRMRAALSFRRFVSEWINQNHVSCPESEVSAALERFKSNQGIQDFAAWLRRNGLTYASFTASMAETVAVDRVMTKGPAAFGLSWDDAAESEAESLFAADMEAFHHPLTLENLPRAAGIEPPAESLKHRSYYQYRFIIEWAQQNGVSPPAESQPVALATGEPQAWRRGLSLASWVLEHGPEHFGLDWMFELDFMHALQMTNQVEHLLSAKTIVLAR